MLKRTGIGLPYVKNRHVITLCCLRCFWVTSICPSLWNSTSVALTLKNRWKQTSVLTNTLLLHLGGPLQEKRCWDRSLLWYDSNDLKVTPRPTCPLHLLIHMRFLNKNISWVRDRQKQMHKALEGFCTQHGATEWSCPVKHWKSSSIKSQKPTLWIFCLSSHNLFT